MRRAHALPAPHHKSNLTLPIDAVPSQTKRVIYLRVREHTNARRRSQSGLPQRSRKQKQTKATKAALGPERPSKKQEPRQADGDRTSRRCQAAKAKRCKVTGQLQVNMSHSSCLRNMQQRCKSSHAQMSEDLETDVFLF